MREKLLLACVFVVVAGTAAYFVFIHDPDQRNWDEVRTRDNIPAYQAFVRDHPESRFLTPAHGRIEALRWGHARNRDHIEGYRDFVAAYPASGHVAEARDRIERLRWDEALASKTLGGMRTFLADFPQTKRANDARQRIESMRWEETTQAGTIADFHEFLAEFPDTALAQAARQRIEALRWEAVVKAHTVQAYRAFLSEFRSSARAAEARSVLDDLTWVAARAAQTIKAVQAYLDSDGPRTHAAAARNLFEDLRWERAIGLDTEEAFDEFLKENPDTKRRAEAITRGYLARWRVKIVRAGTAAVSGPFGDDTLTGVVMDVYRTVGDDAARFDSQDSGIVFIGKDGKEQLKTADVILTIDLGPGVKGLVEGMMYRGYASVSGVRHACPHPGAAPVIDGRIGLHLLSGGFSIVGGARRVDEGSRVRVVFSPSDDQSGRVGDLPRDRNKILAVQALYASQSKDGKRPEGPLASAAFTIDKGSYVRVAILCRGAPDSARAVQVLGKRIRLRGGQPGAWEPAPTFDGASLEHEVPPAGRGPFEKAYGKVVEKALRVDHREYSETKAKLSSSHLARLEANGTGASGKDWLYFGHLCKEAGRHEDALRAYVQVLADGELTAATRARAARATWPVIREFLKDADLGWALAKRAAPLLIDFLEQEGDALKPIDRAVIRLTVADVLGRERQVDQALEQLRLASLESPDNLLTAAHRAARILLTTSHGASDYETVRRKASDLMGLIRREHASMTAEAQESGKDYRIGKAELQRRSIEALSRLLALLGRAPPDWSIEHAFGKPSSLDALRGKIVVLHFWYTTNGRSIQSFAYLRRLLRDYGKKGVTVVGATTSSEQARESNFGSDGDLKDKEDVNTSSSSIRRATDRRKPDGKTVFGPAEYGQRETEIVSRFIANHELNWPIVMIGEDEPEMKYGVLFQPYVMLIDGKGRLRYVHEGALLHKSPPAIDPLRKVLDELLAEAE